MAYLPRHSLFRATWTELWQKHTSAVTHALQAGRSSAATGAQLPSVGCLYHSCAGKASRPPTTLGGGQQKTNKQKPLEIT